jgi:hypothetical protein
MKKGSVLTEIVVPLSISAILLLICWACGCFGDGRDVPQCGKQVK